jgi:uncharacterized protein YdeI (YjbR/CyaY-like superfamily)
MVKTKQDIIPSGSGAKKIGRPTKESKMTLKISKSSDQGVKSPRTHKENPYVRVKADPIYAAFETTELWEAWLSQNGMRIEEFNNLWIKFPKVKVQREVGIPSVTFNEALDVALCYGWVDSTRKVCEEDEANYFIQHFAPRKPNSRWTKLHVTKANELVAAGLMRQEGQLAIEAAKEDGRWYENLEIPDVQVQKNNIQYQPSAEDANGLNGGFVH